MSAVAKLGGKRARHWRKIEAKVSSHEAQHVTWFVIECKCGWSSPLCTSWDHAGTLYERHRHKP